MSEAIVAPFARDLISDANFLGRNRRADQSQFSAVPPRMVGNFLGVACHGHGAIRNLAGIVHAQNLALLIRERVPVILIECSTAIRV